MWTNRIQTPSRVILLFTCVLLASCVSKDSDAEFNRSDASPVQLVANVVRNLDTPPKPQESDTVAPGDSLVFQGDYSPIRNVKIKKYWWVIDGRDLSDDYFVRWAFQESGSHYAVFFAIDQFGDTLSDTAWVQVNSPPKLDSVVTPANLTWGVSNQSPQGIRFEWNTNDPDDQAVLTHHFYLKKNFCENSSYPAFQLDTILHSQSITIWNGLEPLCQYQWTVQSIDEFGSTSDSLPWTTLSTGSIDGSSAVVAKISSPHVQFELKRFGDSSQVHYSDSNQFVLFSRLLPGQYRLILRDTLKIGYQPDTIQIKLPQNRLEDLGSLTLVDNLAPALFCPQCTQDTLLPGSSWKFPVSEKGSGLRRESVSVYLDGKSHPFQFQSDTIVISPIQRPLVNYGHPLEFRLQDSSGNVTRRTFTVWVAP